jgi:hypothetical protein
MSPDLQTQEQPARIAARARPMLGSSGEPRARTRGRAWWSRTQHIVRRPHLYLGLALLPFVALYGATALLFNHASWFQPTAVRAIERELVADSALVALTHDPLATARALVPNEITPLEARWEGAWSFESRADGRGARFDVDAQGRGGRISTWPTAPKLASPLPDRIAAEKLPGWSDPLEAASDFAPKLGLAPDGLASKRAPRLAFTFAHEGRVLRARWDPANGALTVTPNEGRDTVDFLQTLHVAHGTPGFVDARWWWSWVVDAMGVAMLVWAVTGAWLWWSIRAVRRAGLVVMALAAAATFALVLGMHHALPM